MRFSVPPLKLIVPTPLNGPLIAYVPLGKFRLPPLAALKLPGQVEPQAPPALNDTMPLLPLTVPVLLNGTPTVEVAVPPVFSKVPALLNVTAVPPPKTRALSFV